MMKYGLKPVVIEQIKQVFAAHREIDQAILYGSRAKGTYQNASDIDLCLRGENLSLPLQFKIESELEDLLLPYKIDLSIFHQLDSPDLIDHINRVGVELYRRA
jgi:predicted nucleotidyltransferase